MRVAAFQRTAVFDDPETTAARIATDLSWAQAEGVDLAVFPECYLQGHTYNGPLARRRALSLGDLAMKKLVAASPHGPTAILGYFERRDDLVYNSAAVFEGGQLLGNYAKAHPTEDDCAAGTTFPVWPFGNRTFGVNICGDLNYPDAAQRLVAQGASLVVCPLNMMLRPHKAEIWRPISPVKLQDCAKGNAAWVVSADVVGSNADGWISFGCTALVRPDGEIVARVPEGIDGVAVFDIPQG